MNFYAGFKLAYSLIYTQLMLRDAAWVRSQLEQVKLKRELLKMLEGKLAAWDQQADWKDIPPAKRRALMGLAQESKATIGVLMDQVGRDIRNCLEGMRNRHG